jgi:soluble lytic murein transglycosylase
MPEKEHGKVEYLFTTGWIALRFLNDPATAMPYFARIPQVGKHPASLSRGYFWQGRTAEALGRREEARRFYEHGARYPTAYYGQLARAKLGAGEISLPPAPRAAANGSRLEIVRAIEILYAIDERDLVVSAVADIADKTDDVGALAAIAVLTEKNRDPRAQVLLGRTAVARGLPFEAYAYPIAGLPRYNPVGPQVEPHIAYAIARQESGFNPRAVSSANALGLMQVTPAAGKHIAKKNGIAFDAKRLLNDPVYNVQMGAAELGDVIETYRGSYILAFVAYNAGRGRVRQWNERYGDPRDPNVDPVDWVELIPFSETRNYVQRVLENLQVYRVRFGGPSRLMIEADLRRGMSAN